MKIERLRIKNLIAEVGGVRMLNDFHITQNDGEVIGLYIRQGNVKQALTDILQGKHRPLRGDFFVNDKKIEAERLSNHVHVIESKSKLIDGMSIANNLFIIRDGISEQFLENRILDTQAENLLMELNIQISVDEPIYSLTAYDKVLLEIAKAIGLRREIIVFQDISSFLPDAEVDRLSDYIECLTKEGHSFLFVDSYIEVLEKVTDTVIWVKNGRNKWRFEGALPKALYQDSLESYVTTPLSGQTPVLSFRAFPLPFKQQLNLDIYKGDVVNILDKQGDALDWIIKAMQGEHMIPKGSIVLAGAALNIRNTNQAVTKGLGFISDNPTETMLIPDLNALDNLCYIVERKIKWFWMRRKYKASILMNYQHKFNHLDSNLYIDQMSIYDKQRLVYYKWLVFKPKVLLVYRPFSSVDQELRQLTSDLIKEMSESGVSVILLTNNLSEIRIGGRQYEIKSKK